MNLENYDKIEYYLDLCEQYNLSSRELITRIKSKEYERLDEKTREKLKSKNEEYKYEIGDFIKFVIEINDVTKESF